MPLQRNATDHPLDVPAASATVQPGDTLDWPDPVMGFEPADEPTDGDGQEDGEDKPPADTGNVPADDHDGQGRAEEPSPPQNPRKRAAARSAGEEAGK